MNPRVAVLEEMWIDFARANKDEIKGMLPDLSPWDAINIWGARYADWVLNQDQKMIELRIKHFEKP